MRLVDRAPWSIGLALGLALATMAPRSAGAEQPASAPTPLIIQTR